MLKEWFGNRAIDVSGLYLKIKHPQHVTPQANRVLNEILGDIKHKDTVPYSKSIKLLCGYETTVRGKENLEAVKGRFIVIANHFTQAPLGPYPISAYIGNLAETSRDEEFRWVYGKRKSITSFFLERLVKSINGILVDSHAGNKELLRIIEEEKSISLGIYPEGDGGNKIRKANPTFGHIMIEAAERNIPILPIGNLYEGKRKAPGAFIFNIGKPVDPNEIKSIVARSVNHKQAREETAEFCMGKIEELVPEELKEAHGKSVPSIKVTSNSSQTQS